MRTFFLLAVLLIFAGANCVMLLTFCPAFSSQSNTIIQGKVVNEGYVNCTNLITINVTDPLGNVSKYSGVCDPNTGIIAFSISNSLGGKYNIQTTNMSPNYPACKLDTCTFNSLKKSKVSIPDSNFYSVVLLVALVGFAYYKKK